ncbi:ABC transporter, ATP-binding protein [hydrothermal vent metagenome]|uniref:ABC transporter, ATP-binding protein n=1 Tax=hydrothermal vent metagenome TaxID=652676 RepID=A0A3B0TZ28_9ZZZZ
MIEAKNLTKSYDRKIVLNDLNLKIEKGQIFCLLGANGAGKSTTINLFLGFIQADSGEAYINDIDVGQHSLKTKNYLAYIPENLMLYPHLTGLENLEYFTGLAKRRYGKNELNEFLIESGLQESFINKRVSTYSKGMRQKVGIAVALAKKAKALLLDEPTSGLDPKSGNEFAELLIKLSLQDVAVLMATHDLFRAKETGTHIGIMKEGNLVDTFPSAQINHSELEKLYMNHIK